MYLNRRDFVLTTAPARNPSAREIERASLETAIEAGMIDGSNRRRFDAFNTLAPYVYPAATAERAVVCAHWCNWLFFFDDVHDEEREPSADTLRVEREMRRAMRLLEAGELPERPSAFDRYTLDFRARALALTSRAWWSRMCASTRHYLFDGTLSAVRNWAYNRVPGVDEYLLQREYDGAVHTALDLIELADGVTLPEAFFASDTVKRLRCATARTIALFNDIVSYPKEVLVHHNPNNLVHVLMAHRGSGYESAVAESLDIVNAYAREMMDLEPSVLSERLAPEEEVYKYLLGMRRWQVGNIEWSLRGRRYTSSDSALAELSDSRRRAETAPKDNINLSK